MLKLTRKTEYALLSLRWLSQSDTGRQSVRQIAEHYHIPDTLLAKVLQRLKSGGLVTSAKGASGGYKLARSLTEISLINVLNLFDEQVDLVQCISEAEACACDQLAHCDIRQPLEALNMVLLAQITGLSLASFFQSRPGLVDDRALSIMKSNAFAQPA